MIFIRNEIVYKKLGIEKLWGEVHKKNDNAIKIFILSDMKLKIMEKYILGSSLERIISIKHSKT